MVLSRRIADALSRLRRWVRRPHEDRLGRGRGRWRLLVGGLVATALLGIVADLRGPVPALPGYRDAALAHRFTPAYAPAGRYVVHVSDEPIDLLIVRFRERPDAAPGWTIESLEPREAFDGAAPFDRWAVARLYGGQRARVARGVLLDGRRPAASVMLVSPHPNAALSELLPGTMIVLVMLDPQARQRRSASDR